MAKLPLLTEMFIVTPRAIFEDQKPQGFEVQEFQKVDTNKAADAVVEANKPKIDKMGSAYDMSHDWKNFSKKSPAVNPKQQELVLTYSNYLTDMFHSGHFNESQMENLLRNFFADALRKR